MGTQWNKKRLDRVDDEHARCCVCKDVKELAAFGNEDGYYATCYACRYKAKTTQLMGNIDLYLKDRLATIKTRAAIQQVFCYLEVHHLREIWDKQNGLCFYTDVPLNLSKGRYKYPDGLSVDRVDNARGYTPDNVVLCTNKANTVKSNLTMEELQKWIPSWYDKIERYLRLRPPQEASGGWRSPQNNPPVVP